MPRIDFNPQELAPTGVPDLAQARPNQAMAQLGQQAAAVDQTLERIQQRDAAMEGAQALADFRLKREARQQELRTQAKTPDGFVETALTDFDENAQKLLDSHESELTKIFLQERLLAARDDEGQESIVWQANAMQARSEQLAVDTVNKYANMVNTAPGKFESALSDVYAMIDASGLDLVHADKMRAAARSAISRSAVYGQIETNPAGVLKQLQSGKWDAYLDNDAKIAAVNGAQTEIKRRESEARANAAQARQEALFDIDRWSRDNAASLQATGKPVPPPYSDDQLKALLKPRQYEQIKLASEQSRQLFMATGDMRSQTPAEMQATVERLKPEGGVDGFEGKLAIYNAALKIQSNVLDARKENPGLAVRQAVPAVQTAWQKFEQSQKPEDLQAALKQSMLAQTALGIPRDKQRLMPNELIWSMSGAVKSSKPEEAAKVMSATAEAFGPYWNQAFREMSKNLDGHLRVSATVKDSVSAAMLVEGSRQSVTALRKAAGVKEDDKGIGQAVASDDRVIALATSLSQRAGGSGTATQIQASIELLALQRMRSLGEDQASATEAAIQRVVGDNYAFGGGGGFGRAATRSYRIPKQAGDADVINRAALRIQSTLPVQELDLPRDVPGSLKKYTAEAYGNAVRREGFWVTNDDESGVILYAGNVPVTVGGKPVQRTWSELKEVEIPRVGPKAPKPLRPVWPFTGDGE